MISLFCRRMFFQGSDGHYKLAFNRPLSNMTYAITQTHMLSYGHRDQQDMPHAARDAEVLSSTLIDRGLVQQANLRLCRDKRECTTEAVRSAFKAVARCVGDKGTFIFAYHGPAVPCGSSPSLVPSDYRPDSAGTHITATTIRQWLNELDTNRPKQVLFFLDCQFASEIAEPLTGSLPVIGVERFCVFCANPSAYISPLTITLDHSMFTYFAMWAIKKYVPQPGQQVQRLINITAISEGIKECCMALNQLCVHESQDTACAPAVLSVVVQPLHLLLQRFEDERTAGQDVQDGEDTTDGPTLARHSFLEKHYQTGWWKSKMNMCDLGHRWLQYLRYNDASPLHVLRKHKLLSNSELLTTAHRLVLYSLALIQESSGQSSIGDPNTLIMLYMLAAGVIEHVATTDLVASAEQFQLSFEAYCLALDFKKINSSQVCKLAKKVKQENKN